MGSAKEKGRASVSIGTTTGDRLLAPLRRRYGKAVFVPDKYYGIDGKKVTGQ
jgi:hypothetical protein